MRTYWLITFRTVTYAQRAQRALQQKHMFSQLQRTPKMLTVRGCGYCLRLREEDVLAAVAILRSEQIFEHPEHPRLQEFLSKVL